MKRVVVTGIGIYSCIGQSKEEVLESLQKGRSGITYNEDFSQYAIRSLVCGRVDVDNYEDRIERAYKRFMTPSTIYSYLSMEDAIRDAKLTKDMINDDGIGLIFGTGGCSWKCTLEVYNVASKKGAKWVGPYRVPQIMSSSIAANLSTCFKIRGINYCISSACATSLHCIGHAAELIQSGKQHMVFAGGSEELHWMMSAPFDAMGALSRKFNDVPEKSSRPYDRDRDGFVIASGGGCVVLEEYQHAVDRGAKIYAEIVGYGANSDGVDMVAPSGEGAVRCMQMSLQNVKRPVQYINTHGTSTPVGDITELKAIKEVFQDKIPAISSTKALTGHSLGACGVHECIYSLLMLENNFIAASANIEHLDERAVGYPIVREMKSQNLDTVMTNSFGFGGTNATLVLSKV